MKKKKTGNAWNRVSAVVLVLLLVSEALALFQVWKLNMLPGRYFLILAAALVLITGLLCLILFTPKSGKYQKKLRHGKQVAAYILCLVIITLCLLGSYAVGRLNGTLSSITSTSKINVLLEVYVRADDPAEYIQDTAGYTFALAATTDEEDAQKVIAELEGLLGSQPATASYNTVTEMIDALFAGEVDAIILDSSYLSILEDTEAYADFSDRTRMLHEQVIEKEIPKAQENAGSQAVLTTVQDITSTPFLLYISGNDARRELLADGGSDVNILVAVNPVDHQILMVNTPRDYYVVNPASGNGSRDKLSHCGLEGIENSISAISGLYGLSVNYYARINFTGFRTLVDAIGGVTVYSDVAFTAGGYPIQKGENHLNGTQALAFARERKNLAGGDNDRGKNQMKLISAMISQLSAGNLLANYNGILDSLEGMFATSLTSSEIAKLVQMQLLEMSSWDILSIAVTGDNGNDTCWAVGGGYGYVMYPHEDEVAFAADLIGRVLNGEVLTEADLVLE